jgi:hypothetical protein
MATLAQRYVSGPLQVYTITSPPTEKWDLAINLDGNTVYLSFDEARVLVATLSRLIPDTSIPATQPTEEVK